jgi:hypothetical protein
LIKTKDLYRFLALLAVFCIFFTFSYYIAPYNSEGDQQHYNKFYDGISSYSYLEGLIFYRSALGSSEPVYYSMVWLLADLIEKNSMMSLLNALLGTLLFQWMFKHRVSMFVIAMQSMNFYLLVLFFAAERLKLAVLFLMISVYLLGWLRYLFIGFSVLSHAQMVILIVARMFSTYTLELASILHGYIRRKTIILYFFGIAAFIAILVPIYPHILQKYNHYSFRVSQVSVWYEIIKPIIFMLMTLPYALKLNTGLESFYMHVTLTIAIMFVGNDRLVIISFFIFMYYALRVHRGLNLGVLVLSVYFGIKGIVFLNKIFLYGNGFSKIMPDYFQI